LFDLILCIPAIVFGALGIKSSRKNMAIVGIVLGAIGVILAIIFFQVGLDVLNDPTKYGLPANTFDAYR